MDNITLTVRIIVTIALLIAAILSRTMYNIIRKKHLLDPEFQKKQEERAAEYRRKIQEDKELEQFAFSYTNETYSDQ